MYAEDVSDLNSEVVLKCLSEWRRNPKNRTVPLPAQIREMIEPQAADEDTQARELTARIIQAVDKFGYTWPKEARNFIGEIGWSAVQVYGGWENFCEGLGTRFSSDACSAQIRELLKGRIKHGAGLGEQVQSIEYKAKGNDMGAVMQLIKPKDMP